ncbi:hypothetical protein TNCT_219081 [Trichonephila clavata]|uniref:Uncharacterized protein n=1 Tax=Trichonephila clavata TaxID=2740835 RepID=A0A8X6GIP7_TRICU|nr:hypothetical protein TNCT_219081 [Trichonephila clavata]
MDNQRSLGKEPVANNTSIHHSKGPTGTGQLANESSREVASSTHKSPYLLDWVLDTDSHVRTLSGPVAREEED